VIRCAKTWRSSVKVPTPPRRSRPPGAARVVDLDGHLDPLACSAQAMAIGNPSRDQWRGLVAEAQAGWSTPGEAVLKLVLTRGREWRAVGPTATVTITHRGPWSATGDGAGEASRTITAVTLSRGHPSDAFADAPWLLGGIKTLSHVVNAAAAREARRRGADDVIFKRPTVTPWRSVRRPLFQLIHPRRPHRGSRLEQTCNP